MTFFALNQAGLVQHLRASALMVFVGVLVACSGGGFGDQAGVGSGGTGVNIGQVSGLGSVFVDGVEIEDQDVAAQTLDAQHRWSAAQPQLGQQLRVVHRQQVAQQLWLWPAVVGSVQAIQGPEGTLQVAGQTVRVLSGGAQTPLTVWAGGLDKLAQVRLGDVIEVHGPRGPDLVIEATRIERRSDAPPTQIWAPILALGNAPSAWTLPGQVLVDSSDLTPEGPGPSVGQWWRFSGAMVGNRLQAVAMQARPSVSPGTAMKITGPLADVQGPGLRIDDQRINAQALLPDVTLESGRWATVTGDLDESGVLKASALVWLADAPAQVQLIGPISDWVDASSFQVREVPVDAASATLQGCPASGLQEGRVVRIQAQRQANTLVVRASAITCLSTQDDEGTWSDGAGAPAKPLVMTWHGTVVSVDEAQRRLVLRDDAQALRTLRWEAARLVLPPGIQVRDLVSQNVRASGVRQQGQDWLLGLRREGGADSDRFRPSDREGWNRYRNPSPGNSP